MDHEEQQQKRLREAVDSLLRAVSEADRILLMLKEVEGLSLKELEKTYMATKMLLRCACFGPAVGLESIRREGAKPGWLKGRFLGSWAETQEGKRYLPGDEGKNEEKLDALFQVSATHVRTANRA